VHSRHKHVTVFLVRSVPMSSLELRAENAEAEAQELRRVLKNVLERNKQLARELEHDVYKEVGREPMGGLAQERTMKQEPGLKAEEDVGDDEDVAIWKQRAHELNVARMLAESAVDEFRKSADKYKHEANMLDRQLRDLRRENSALRRTVRGMQEEQAVAETATDNLHVRVRGDIRALENQLHIAVATAAHIGRYMQTGQPRAPEADAEEVTSSESG